MNRDPLKSLRELKCATRRLSIRIALELALIVSLGAISGLGLSHLPVVRQSIRSVRLHFGGAGPHIEGSRFRIAGAPKSYLVIYTSPSCWFSVASMPFHRKIIEQARTAGLTVYVAVHQAAEATQYEKMGEFSGVHFMVGSALPVEPVGTPTVLLIRNAFVSQVWSGLQRREEQRSELLATIALANPRN